jgi:hypothetical protein
MAPVPMLPEFGSPLGIGLIGFAVFAVLYVANSLFFSVPYPKGVPLIREPPGKTSFSWKTRLAYFTDCQSVFREAYQNVRFC